MAGSAPEPQRTAVAFGEAMLRLSPPGRVRLEQARGLEVHVGGAELNVLIVLAQLGWRARWVSGLPDNPLGRLIERHARAFGVEVAARWDAAGRAGLYFVEHGAPPRPSEVLYDRAGSVASRLGPGQLDWGALLAGAACLHVSGITCGLGEGPHKAALEGLAAARDRGVATSFDVNYRSRLWPPQAARPRLLEALPASDVLFASAHDLALLLDEPLAEAGPDAAVPAARRLAERHGIGAVVLPGREDAGHDSVRTSATAVLAGGQVIRGEPCEAQVVDAFGAGDAGAAGFLAAYLAGEPAEVAVAQAARLAALAHTVEGDALLLRDQERTATYGQGRRIMR
jgi:2-dehydro-3-deoxygluconokinase